MAFGFRRERGTGRGYVADGSNPEYAAGTRLSRRQYDKYTERLGARTHLPGVAAIRETERRLEQLRRKLEAEEIEPSEADEERFDLLRRRRDLEGQSPRLARQGAGQRRYNQALDRYVEAEREAGRPIGKRAASRSADFQQIWADIKGQPNKRNNPNIAARNRARANAAYARLGGARAFWEDYHRRYPRERSSLPPGVTPIRGGRRLPGGARGGQVGGRRYK